PGWTLTAPDPRQVELTAGDYRIPVAPGTAELAVVEERPLLETVQLADLHDDALAAYAAASEFDPALRKALAGLAARRQAVSRQRAELDRLKAHRAELVADETRLRDNLAALAHDAPLRKRVLDKFAETESAIDAASEAVAKASAALATDEAALASYVAGLKLSGLSRSICSRPGSCEASQPPPSASISATLATSRLCRRLTRVTASPSAVVWATMTAV